jgi:hypothetical protein
MCVLNKYLISKNDLLLMLEFFVHVIEMKPRLGFGN